MNEMQHDGQPGGRSADSCQMEKRQMAESLGGGNVPQHICEMESILDEAVRKMDALERMIAEYEEFQTEIGRLEAYYTSQQWKDDYAMDEAGAFPEELKRGVLSQDGIWNMLERNRELTERIGIGSGGDCAGK